MQHWVGFKKEGYRGFGVLSGGRIAVHAGDMFGASQPTGVHLNLSEVVLATPVVPGKMIVMWNNSRAIAAKKGTPLPPHPIYFLKPDNTFLAAGETIRYPRGRSERVVLEGEIGVVIGKTARQVGLEEADEYIFGYTCVNDVTALDILENDNYPQHVMSKSFDTFGVFGPVVARGMSPDTLKVESFVNGERCQDYGVDDLAFGPRELVSRLSQTMTLNPGDMIACGTSLGVSTIRPGDRVTIRIAGVGELSNIVE